MNTRKSILFRCKTMLLPAVFVCAVLIVGAACHADDSVPTKLSLADALTTALNANPNLRQEQESHLTSLSNLRVAGFTTSYNMSSTTQLDRATAGHGISGLLKSGATFSALTGSSATVSLCPLGLGTQRGAVDIQIMRPLVSGRGLLSAKSDQLLTARSQSGQEDKTLHSLRQSTSYAVIRDYYNAVLQREMIKVTEHSVKIAEELLECAKNRVEAEISPGMEVTSAEVQVKAAQDQLNTQRRTAQEALDLLMYDIGTGVGKAPELTDPLPQTIPDVPPLKEAVSRALANRDELAISDLRIANQKRQVAITKDKLRPQLDAVAGFNSTSGDTGLMTSSMLTAGAFNAGLQLTLPMDKRINVENHENAKRELAKLEESRDYQTEQINKDALNAYRRIESERSSVDILTQDQKMAEENLRLYRMAFDEGVRYNIQDVLSVQNQLIQVEGSLLSAKTQLYLATVDLKYYMGEDLIETGSK